MKIRFKLKKTAILVVSVTCILLTSSLGFDPGSPWVQSICFDTNPYPGGIGQCLWTRTVAGVVGVRPDTSDEDSDCWNGGPMQYGDVHWFSSFAGSTGGRRKRYILTESAALSGAVREEGTGNPVPGAEVGTIVTASRSISAKGNRSHGQLMLRPVRTDSRGEYLILRPPVGQAFHVWAASDKHLMSTARVKIRSGEAKRVDIRLRRAQTVPLRVRNESDEPISGARIRTESRRPVITDERGTANILIEAEAKTQIHCSVEAKGYLNQRVVVEKGAAEHLVVLEDAPLFLGTVRNGEGDPIAQAKVVLVSGPRLGRRFDETQTDEEGAFEFRPSEPQLRSVRITHAEYLGQEAFFEDEVVPHHLEISLERGTSALYGRVFSSEGQAMSLFSVKLSRHPDHRSGGFISKAFDDTDGWFSFSGLPEGIYDLTVRSAGTPVAQTEAAGMKGVELLSGQAYGELAIQLERRSPKQR